MANQNALNNTNKGDFIIAGDCYVGNTSPASPVEFNVEGTKAGGDVNAEVRNTSGTAGSTANVNIVSSGGDSRLLFQR